MTKEPARRESGTDGWMLGAAGAGGWSCAGRVRTVSKLKVRAGIILGPHAARTLSKLDLGMRTGTEAQSNAEEGGRAHQPHHRMALASSKANELGNARHSLMMRLRSRRRARAGEWARGPRRLIEHTCSPARGTQRPRAPRALDQPLTSARHRELERPRSAASKACDPPQIARQSSGQSGQRSLHKKSAG